MAQTSTTTKLATNWRWWMCVLLFVATTVNYMDRVAYMERFYRARISLDR